MRSNSTRMENISATKTIPTAPIPVLLARLSLAEITFLLLFDSSSGFMVRSFNI